MSLIIKVTQSETGVILNLHPSDWPFIWWMACLKAHHDFSDWSQYKNKILTPAAAAAGAGVVVVVVVVVGAEGP